MTPPSFPYIDLRPARFPLTGEAQDLAVKRARALSLLGPRWVLHPSHAPKRLPAPEPGPIEAQVRSRRLMAELGRPKDVILSPEARVEVIELLTGRVLR